MLRLLGILLIAMTHLSTTAVEVSKGTLHKLEPVTSKFVSDRNVHIWLPPGYSRDNLYPVLYMHDGQMLFDAKTTWNKTAWDVDDVAADLIEQGKVRPFIVVGIFNIAELRHGDYYPQRAFEMLPESDQKQLMKIQRSPGELMLDGEMRADNYLKFIVNELKPYIDKHYATLSNRDNTYIMGSSMGGLISMYAISEYPEIFGAAACLSTHWTGVTPDKGEIASVGFFQYMQQKLPSAQTHRLYFDIGTATLDQYYPPYQLKADQIMRNKGFNQTNWMSKVFEGEAHTETAWNKRLHIPLTFLLGNH